MSTTWELTIWDGAHMRSNHGSLLTKRACRELAHRYTNASHYTITKWVNGFPLRTTRFAIVSPKSTNDERPV